MRRPPGRERRYHSIRAPESIPGRQGPPLQSNHRGPLAFGSRELERASVTSISDPGSKMHAHRGLRAAERDQPDAYAIVAAQELALLEIHDFEIVPAAVALSARAIAVLHEAALRGAADLDELAVWIEHAQIDVGLGLLPRHEELGEPGR